MNKLKIFYFCYFGAGAALMPFLVLYYEQLHLSGDQIAVLAALPPLITLFAASLWGGLADATRQHSRLLVIAMICTISLVLLLSRMTSFGLLVGVIALYAFCGAPIMPLADNATLTLLRDQKHLYGRLRLWGAVGWGVTAPLVGQLAERFGAGWSFYAYALLMAGGLVVAVRLPVAEATLGQPFWRGFARLLSDRRWFFFLAAIYITGVGSGVVNSYLFLYMERLGATRTLMGLSLSIATVSELIVFALSDRLLARWGVRRLLVVAFGAVIVRLLAYALIQSPWLVLPVQLLHGLTFSVLWIAGVAYADRIAPQGMGATAQGLFSGVSMGVASATGAFVGGLLYGRIGFATTFGILGLGILISLSVLALVERLSAPTHVNRPEHSAGA